MDAQQLLNFFIEHEGPWAILFVFLLIYQIKDSRDREEKNRARLDEKLEEINLNTKLMLTTWKIIIERELERRETKHGIQSNSNKRGGDSTAGRSTSTSNKNGNTTESE